MFDLDLILTILHHLIVLALVAIIFVELVVVRSGMDAAIARRVAATDAWYGILAGLIVFVGFGRAIFAAKGWYYCAHNLFFWAKISTFVIIGLLSIPPTLAYLKWRKECTTPTDETVANLRRVSLDRSGSARATAGLCSGNGSRVRPVLIEFPRLQRRS